MEVAGQKWTIRECACVSVIVLAAALLAISSPEFVAFELIIISVFAVGVLLMTLRYFGWLEACMTPCDAVSF